MIPRWAGRAEAGDEAERFPPGELSRMNAIEPTVIEPRLRGHHETTLTAAAHHPDRKGGGRCQRLAVQRAGQVEVSPVKPHRTEGSGAVQEPALQPANSLRFDGYA